MRETATPERLAGNEKREQLREDTERTPQFGILRLFEFD